MMITVFLFAIVMANPCNKLKKFGAEDFSKYFKRIIVKTTNQPNPGNNFANVYDPFHGRAIDADLYTGAEMASMTAQAIAYFGNTSTYGLNFSPATYNATTDIYTIPGVAQLLPYGNGLVGEHKIAFDSAHPGRGCNGDWIAATFGEAVLMLSGGIFPNGMRYSPSDLMFFADVNMLRVGHNWGHHKNRENIQITSVYPIVQLNNSIGAIEQHAGLTATTLVDGPTVSTFISIIQLLNSTTLYQRNNDIYMWPV